MEYLKLKKIWNVNIYVDKKCCFVGASVQKPDFKWKTRYILEHEPTTEELERMMMSNTSIKELDYTYAFVQEGYGVTNK